MAVLCGAEGWVAVEAYGISKKEWLEQFLELPNGIPSHDTFGLNFSSGKILVVKAETQTGGGLAVAVSCQSALG